jgi:hypothetical protein
MNSVLIRYLYIHLIYSLTSEPKSRSRDLRSSCPGTYTPVRTAEESTYMHSGIVVSSAFLIIVLAALHLRRVP